jgi:hypothetical protein
MFSKIPLNYICLLHIVLEIASESVERPTSFRGVQYATIPYWPPTATNPHSEPDSRDGHFLLGMTILEHQQGIFVGCGQRQHLSIWVGISAKPLVKQSTLLQKNFRECGTSTQWTHCSPPYPAWTFFALAKCTIVGFGTAHRPQLFHQLLKLIHQEESISIDNK